MKIDQNIHTFEANVEPFESRFGIPLRDYFSFLTGFQIVQFCSDVLKGHPQDWECEVRSKYDEDGVFIIKNLLGIKEEDEEHS